MHVGGPVQPQAVVVLADFVEPHRAGALVLDTIGFLPGDVDDETDLGELRTVRVYAGYAGWGPGQLEDELDEQSWVVLPARAVGRLHGRARRPVVGGSPPARGCARHPRAPPRGPARQLTCHSYAEPGPKRKQFVWNHALGMTAGVQPFTLFERAEAHSIAAARGVDLRTHPRPCGPVCAARPNTKERDLETSIIEIPAVDAFAAEAEERGKVEAHELDALVLEHELDEEAVTALRTLLTERGVELPVDEDEVELDLDPPGAVPRRPTRSACSSRRSAATSC